MKKLLFPVAFIALVLVCLALLDRACSGPDPEYWIARDRYLADVAAWDKQHEADLEALAASDALLAAKDEEIAAANSRASAAEARAAQQAQDGRAMAVENARLKRDAQAAIDANPAVRALVDNFELRCANYEDQIFTLNQRNAEHLAIIDAQGVQIVQLAFQRDTWKKSYDEEHSLRLAGDSIRETLEHQWEKSKFWIFVGKYGPPVAFGLGLFLGK
jgi:hypothetical protein